MLPYKERLVEAYLERRDRQWQDSLARHVDRRADPRQRVLAVFGFLAEWSAMPDLRGCAFINAFGELGTESETIARITRNHETRLRRYLADLAVAAGAAAPHALADQLLLLIDGAIVSAATGTNPRAAARPQFARPATERPIWAAAASDRSRHTGEQIGWSERIARRSLPPIDDHGH